METLYRKVILNIVDRCFHMYASDYRKEAKESAIEMLKEIPDTSHQIEKLEAEAEKYANSLELRVHNIDNSELYDKSLEGFLAGAEFAQKSTKKEVLENAKILLNMFCILDSDNQSYWSPKEMQAVQYIHDQILKNFKI